jgi:predicted dehydrogenase
MELKKVRTTLVGVGEIGLFRGIITKALPEYKLVCVVEKNPIMARIISKQLGVPFYTRFKDAVKKEEFDAVILSTPEHTHYELAQEILNNRKHIFCEKPLTTSASQSLDILKKAKELDIVNQVGYTLRFHPTFAKTKELLDTGIIGNIVYIKVIGHNSEVIKKETRAEKKDHEKRFGIYGSFSVHHIDLMLWFAGHVNKISAYSRKVFSSSLNDLVVAILRFNNNAIGNLDIGWSHHGIEKNPVDIFITGTEGSLHVDLDHIEIFLDSKKNGFQTGMNTIYNSQLGMGVGFELGGKNLSPEMEKFAAAILNNEETSPNWKDGYTVDEFVSALNKSIAENKEISLPLTEDE